MPPLSVMIKPASSACNMRCSYCFYHDVSEHREDFSLGIMTQKTAEILIEKALHFANGHSVAFAFQGGEPLLRGIEFFENFTRLVKEKNTKKSPITYALQTNGILIDDAFARFFAKQGFLIGLSLDGDYEGNRFRLNNDKENAYFKIMKAAKLLKKHRVEFNILVVMTGYCANNIERIYEFFRKEGFLFLQFIPCLRPFNDKSENELYMTKEQYAECLIRLFNLYVKDYVRGRYISIRYFDNLVRLYLRQKPELCGVEGHCTFQYVAEGNGNIYPCDFYCTDEWLLGNIEENDFFDFSNGEKQRQFIKESLHLEERCKSCNYFLLCRGGGCKRIKADRDYCESYKAFFRACLPLFRVFANEKQ